MEKPKKFWMIFVSGGKSPTHAHTSYDMASKEAKRLCKQENVVTFVLESVGYYYPPEKPIPIFSNEFVKD